jgi:hypothetical protein
MGSKVHCRIESMLQFLAGQVAQLPDADIKFSTDVR